MKSMTWEEFENFVRENGAWTHFSGLGGYMYNKESYKPREFIRMARSACDWPPPCREEGSLGIPEIEWDGDIFVPKDDFDMINQPDR